MIPLVDLKLQYLSIKKEIDQAIQQVIDNTAFIMGTDVRALEEEIAQYLGVKYAIGVSSGTDALEIALVSLGVGEGDEVITTPFTFIATTEAIVNAGAKPVFADIDPRSYCLNPDLIERKINNHTKAILPVHLYGHPAEVEKITAVAQKYSLLVVEDCAQSFGAEYNGKKVGSIGHAGCLSFFPGKNLGCFGDGGMVVTNSAEAGEIAKMLRQHGSKKKYYHSINGYNSRLDTLQAAILRVKLKYLDDWNQKRNEHAALYAKLLAENKDIITPSVGLNIKHSFNYYTLRVKDRKKLQARLKSAGISNMIYYPLCLHLQEVYHGLGYQVGDFPVAEKATAEVLSLPMYPELTTEQITEICGVLNG